MRIEERRGRLGSSEDEQETGRGGREGRRWEDERRAAAWRGRGTGRRKRFPLKDGKGRKPYQQQRPEPLEQVMDNGCAL